MLTTQLIRSWRGLVHEREGKGKKGTKGGLDVRSAEGVESEESKPKKTDEISLFGCCALFLPIIHLVPANLVNTSSLLSISNAMRFSSTASQHRSYSRSLIPSCPMLNCLVASCIPPTSHTNESRQENPRDKMRKQSVAG